VFCNPAKLNDLDKFSEIEKTKIPIQVGDEVKIKTCKEAVDSKIIPNKFVAY